MLALSKFFTLRLQLRIYLSYSLLFSGLFILISQHANAVNATDVNTQTSAQLSQVQQQIAAQKTKISTTKKQRLSLTDKLKHDDLAIANVAKQLQQTKQKLQQTTEKLTQLSNQQQTLTTEKRQQEQQLAEQLRTAYANGQHDYIKLLLNQKDPAKIQRTISYYHYLTAAKINDIKQYKATLAALVEVKQQTLTQQTELAQINNQQQAQQTQLSSAKQTRQQTLTDLNKQLQTDQQKLSQLKAQEENLVAALKKLAQAAQAELDLTGLANLKHQLFWPTKGRLTNRFGNLKQGYLRWKGILIAAPVGQTVKTISNGKVLFADWLNGYGLVIVIDHGNGYMSLYGQNQVLLKNVGDRVETGEPIALVGQSGGQSNSGLYFEIRYQGKALNPKIWCR